MALATPTTAPVDLIALLTQRVPLYAVLDAARSFKIREYLEKSQEEHQSLLEGPDAAESADYAPYLVRITQPKLLATLLHKGWGDSWGIYLTCAADFTAMRKHLRHFLSVRLPDGRQAFFRFYDPRVLRVFLPACQEAEAQQFFGPVTAYLLEDADPATLLTFSPDTPRPRLEKTAVMIPELLDYQTIIPG
jgi:hypothetical protein